MPEPDSPWGVSRVGLAGRRDPDSARLRDGHFPNAGFLADQTHEPRQVCSGWKLTRRRAAIALATMRASVPAITAVTLLLLSGLISVGCSTGRHQSGNLARVIAQHLKEYGADLPHINLQQPAIGIDQMYTSWRWEGDPGGFMLTFQNGAFDGVLYQMKQIAGEPQSTPDAAVHLWQLDRVAHLDLVRLSSGKAQLTCRRLLGPSTAMAAREIAPDPHGRQP